MRSGKGPCPAEEEHDAQPKAGGWPPVLPPLMKMRPPPVPLAGGNSPATPHGRAFAWQLEFPPGSPGPSASRFQCNCSTIAHYYVR